MKSLFCVMAFSLAMLPLTACSTLTDTSAENGNRIVRTFDTNGKEMVDDADVILLIDRPSWLSDKPVPNQ